MAQGSMRTERNSPRPRQLLVHQQRETKPDQQLADIADHNQHDRVPHGTELKLGEEYRKRKFAEPDPMAGIADHAVR